MRAEAAAKAPKGATLGLRISDELRAALEAQAAVSSRSMSQVAVQWLEQARAAAAYGSTLDDPSPLGEAFRRLVGFADRVREEIGDPNEDPYAREALIHGWQTIVARGFPTTKPSAEALALAMRRQDLRMAAAELLKTTRGVALADPQNAFVQALQTAPAPVAVNIFAFEPGGAPPKVDPLRRLTTAELLLQLGGDDPINIEAVADALFPRLDKLVEDMPAAALEPFAGALEALQRARTAELKAQTTHLQKRVDAYRAGAALVDATLGRVADYDAAASPEAR